jgi:hypothetical protein
VFFKLLLASALAAGLSQDDYRAREMALRALEAANEAFDLRVPLRGFLRSTDPEVAGRAERALATYDDVWVGINQVPMLSYFDRSPYTVMYDCAWGAMDLLAANRFIGGDEGGYPTDDDRRDAAVDYVRSLLDAGRTRQEVVRLVRKAAWREQNPSLPEPREVKK